MLMVRSFADAATDHFFRNSICPAQWLPIARIAKRKLDLLDAARKLIDLRAPPGNRLELLKGDRRGQHSIRINDRYRVCFRWADEGPTDVEIVDYHRG